MPAPTDPQQTRRDLGPSTLRGETRKRELLSAARRVFEREGFAVTNVAMIVKEAGVSRGTFYTYYDTKEAIFEAVAREVVDDIFEAMKKPLPAAEFSRRISMMVERFIETYRPNARMLGLMEGVGAFSPELSYLRLEARQVFIDRMRRGFERLQAAGIADPDLDAYYTAENLGSMLDQTCHVWFTLNQEYDTRRVTDSLSRIWLKALINPASPAA